MLNKTMQKSVIVMLLVFGILLTTAAPSALAGDKRCKKGSNYYTSNYNDDYYDRDRDQRRRRDRDYDDDYYRRDRRNSASKEVLRDVGIGAAVGAGGGVLLGGKKGAIIGAAIGAAGGYVYNRGKKNRW